MKRKFKKNDLISLKRYPDSVCRVTGTNSNGMVFGIMVDKETNQALTGRIPFAYQNDCKKLEV